MARSDERPVTVDEVRACWYPLDQVRDVYAQARIVGVEPDAVDVFDRPAWSAAAILRWRRKRDEQERQADADRAAWSQLERDTAAWQARRTAAIRQAQEVEARKTGRLAGADFSVGIPTQSPEDAARVRAAGRHAGEQYERATPRPRVNGEALVPLVYVDESEEGSMLARAVGAVKGPRVTDADREAAGELEVL